MARRPGGEATGLRARRRESVYVFWSITLPAMNPLCQLGVHRPILASIVRKDGQLQAMCEACSEPIERRQNRWSLAARPTTEAVNPRP